MTAPTPDTVRIPPSTTSTAPVSDEAEQWLEVFDRAAARGMLKAALRAAAAVLGDSGTRDLLCDWMAGKRLLGRIRGHRDDYDRDDLERAIQDVHDAHHGGGAIRWCSQDLCRAFEGD